MSDTPRTDAMITSVQGGMFTDKSDGITAEEDFQDKSIDLCRTLERENNQLRADLKHCAEALKRSASELECCTSFPGHMHNDKERVERNAMMVANNKALSLTSVQNALKEKWFYERLVFSGS